VFHLCRLCATECVQGRICNHTPTERAITGAFVSCELRLALKYGYTILETYETWHYPHTMTYSRENHGLLSEFVNFCLKIKQQADGWPSENMTLVEKQDYINKYMEDNGILLDENQIEKNPVKRALGNITFVIL
jgi:hypothetical protein